MVANGTASCLLSVPTAHRDVLHSAHYQQMCVVHVSTDVPTVVDDAMHLSDFHQTHGVGKQAFVHQLHKYMPKQHCLHKQQTL